MAILETTLLFEVAATPPEDGTVATLLFVTMLAVSNQDQMHVILNPRDGFDCNVKLLHRMKSPREGFSRRSSSILGPMGLLEAGVSAYSPWKAK